MTGLQPGPGGGLIVTAAAGDVPTDSRLVMYLHVGLDGSTLWCCLRCGMPAKFTGPTDLFRLVWAAHLADCDGTDRLAKERRMLLNRMSRVSEQEFGTGWYAGLEEILWRRGGDWLEAARIVGWPRNADGVQGWDTYADAERFYSSLAPREAKPRLFDGDESVKEMLRSLLKGDL